MRKNNTHPHRSRGPLLAMTLILCFFITSLILPVSRGESPIDLGLDLAGGVVVTYRPDFSSRLDSYKHLDDEEILQLSKEILQSRLYRSLSTTPDIVVRGDQRIVVSLPGSHDAHRVLDVVGKTYRLTLRQVLAEHPEPEGGGELFSYQGRHLELAPVEFSGDMFDERAIRVESGDAGDFDIAPRVTFRFSPPHDDAFARFTRDRVGEELAILLDDRIEWVGVIESAITGVGMLRGNYGLDEARDLAVMLRSGSLPLSLEVESVSASGPGLGQEIRDLGWQALGLSLAGLVTLILLAYVHRLRLVLTGLASLACLLASIAGLTSVFGLTLDLVGIAGLILSVGMGMDAFILVFEALEGRRRELSPKQLATHFDRIVRGAYSFTGEGRTLFHANATTLLVVLLLLSTERLKSFALMILVGLSASIFTIFMTREILRFTRGPAAGTGRDRDGFELLRGLRQARPRIFRLRKLYFAALVIGLLVTGWQTLGSGAPGAELGADFKAGTQLVLAGEDGPVRGSIESLRNRFPDLEVRAQRLDAETGTRYLVTVGAPLTLETASDSSRTAPAPAGTLDARELRATLASDAVDVESLSSIDGKLSHRRMAASLSVLILSFLFLALYFVVFQGPIDRFFAAGRQRAERLARGPLATRLTIWGGVLLAVVTDVAVLLMTVIWLGIPINLPIVAALLTIVGYSVNDSVVLWSHVQARWGELAARGETRDPLEIVTGSVDRILGRALLTTVSTLVPAIAILGVDLSPLTGFAQVMIAGTVAGTLSSMFVVGSFAVRALEHMPRANAAAIPRPEPRPEPRPSGRRSLSRKATAA